MQQKEKEVSVMGLFVLFATLLNIVIIKHAFVTDPSWYVVLGITLPLLAVSLVLFGQKHSHSK